MNEYYKSFNNNLKKILDNNFNENDQNIVNDFVSKISQYYNIYKENQKSIFNTILDFNDDFKDIKENAEKVSGAIAELKEAIEGKELILKMLK